MKKDLISIIVPVYKVEQYLDKCVNSIINQTYTSLEIILVDDGSPDNCGKMCDDYARADMRVKVIHKQNGGVSSARNAGLEIAQGEFIAFVDSDDYLGKDMYEKLIAKQKEKNADVVFCRFNSVSGEQITHVHEGALQDFCRTGDLVYNLNHCTTETIKGDTSYIEHLVMCDIWRAIYKASVLQDIRFDVGVKYMEDVIFYMSVLKKDNLVLDYVDEYLYNYLYRADSASNGNSVAMLENCKNYISSISKLLSGTKNEKYIAPLKFYCYTTCYMNAIKFNVKVDLLDIKDWCNCENYRANKKITYGLKSKIKFFLVYHKLNWLIKLLIRK